MARGNVLRMGRRRGLILVLVLLAAGLSATAAMEALLELADPKDRYIGCFVSDKDGRRPLQNAVAEIAPNDGSPSVRSANFFRYAFTMPDGEVIHVRSTKHHGTIKLWLRAENDLENRMDCYEAFCDFEVEETGEVGTATAEYSVMPVWPRWLVPALPLPGLLALAALLAGLGLRATRGLRVRA